MGLYWFMNSFLQIIIQLVTDKFIKTGVKKDDEVIIEAKNVKIEDEKPDSENEENAENTSDSPIVSEQKKQGNNKHKNKKKKK